MAKYYRGDFFGSGRRLKHVLLLVGGLIILYVFIGGDSGLLQIWKQDRRRQDFETELKQQEALNVRLKNERDALRRKDPATIEKKAREELGMVKKGEEVFQVLVEEKGK